MKVACCLAIVATVVLLAAPAEAHELTPEQLGNLSFQQRLGALVPLDLPFRDENGNPVTFGSYFGAQKPIVLTLNYFHCQNLCPLELEGLANAMNAVPFSLGGEYDVVSVSIDPNEGPAEASAARLRALRAYNRRQDTTGWHLLTGDQASIDKLAQSVGFTYSFDPDANEFAHPVGVVVLTPAGEVSRYLFGLDYAASDVRLALIDASADRIGSLLDRAVLLCYHYDPLTGRYTPLALNLLRGGGVAGVLALVILLGFLWRGDLVSRK